MNEPMYVWSQFFSSFAFLKQSQDGLYFMNNIKAGYQIQHLWLPLKKLHLTSFEWYIFKSSNLINFEGDTCDVFSYFSTT